MEIIDLCPDCKVPPGQPHTEGCDIARCPACGQQRIQCDEHGHVRAASIWTGQWPGKAECERLGWWAYFVPFKGWISCPKETPAAVADLNRLSDAAAKGELVWDPARQEFVRPQEKGHVS